MKVLCAYSGVEFSVEHFPGVLYSREAAHPIFSVPQKQLIVYLNKWSAGELTDTDNYLLFLAILRSSELVSFNVPAARTPFTPSIIAQNMEALSRAVLHLNTVANPDITFPHCAITPETKFLSNVKTWIQNWEECYNEYITSFKERSGRAYDDRKFERLERRDAALSRMIDPNRKSSKQMAQSIADWAADAGKFPISMTTSPFTNLPISLCDYWKQIIIYSAKNERIHEVDNDDFDELLEHCESHIDYGSSFSRKLFEILRNTRNKKKNYLDLKDYDLPLPGQKNYRFIDNMDDVDAVEKANIQAMIDSAPKELPRLEQYPTKMKYMIAKSRWDAAQRYKKDGC